MRPSLLCIMLLTFTSPVLCASVTEDEQDRAYIRCLAARNVKPPNIPREDSAFCLKEAGIEDPGDAARRTKWNAWRDCLIDKAVELDDAVSPAPDIGRAIIISCSVQWKEYVAALAMYPSAKRAMANGLEKYGVNDGVQAVLLVRKAKRESQRRPEEKRN